MSFARARHAFPTFGIHVRARCEISWIAATSLLDCPRFLDVTIPTRNLLHRLHELENQSKSGIPPAGGPFISPYPDTELIDLAPSGVTHRFSSSTKSIRIASMMDIF